MTPDERQQVRASCIAIALGLALWTLGVLLAEGHLAIPAPSEPAIVVIEDSK